MNRQEFIIDAVKNPGKVYKRTDNIGYGCHRCFRANIDKHNSLTFQGSDPGAWADLNSIVDTDYHPLAPEQDDFVKEYNAATMAGNFFVKIPEAIQLEIDRKIKIALEGLR